MKETWVAGATSSKAKKPESRGRKKVVKFVPIEDVEEEESGNETTDKSDDEREEIPVRTRRQKSPGNLPKIVSAPAVAIKTPGPFKSQVALEEDKLAEAIAEKILDAPYETTGRTEARISAKVRAALKKRLARQPVERNLKTVFVDEQIEKPDVDIVVVEELPLPSYFVIGDDSEIAPGVRVAGDPVLQYLNDHAGTEPKEIVVSHESQAIRSVFPKINNVGQEEAILDSGSQIVSMAEKVATRLGLTWDPNVKIHMQSANGQINQTLGLARNVCFTLGGLSIFLQVHIIQDPPYNVLLGRPFDVLTKMTVKNDADGGQKLLVTDPNSERQVVLPTYRRGESPDDLQNSKYFQKASMT